MITKRQGLVIWFQHMKNLKHIKRYGNLVYVSRKHKYAIVYVNQDQVETAEQKLLRHSFVSKVDRSCKPFIRTDFETRKEDETKDYNYKMGI